MFLSLSCPIAETRKCRSKFEALSEVNKIVLLILIQSSLFKSKNKTHERISSSSFYWHDLNCNVDLKENRQYIKTKKSKVLFQTAHPSIHKYLHSSYFLVRNKAYLILRVNPCVEAVKWW